MTLDFQEMLQELYEKRETGSLGKVREQAWNKFQELGLPTRKNELYRYIKLRNLFSQSFKMAEASKITKETIAPYVYPECKQSVLVFINGHYNPDLSNTTSIPSRMVIAPLKEAVNTYGAFLDNQLKQSMRAEIDPFAAINTSLHREGLFLYIPPNSIIETPIQLLHVVDAKESIIAMPRVHLFVGKSSIVNLFHTQKSHNNKPAFVNNTIEMTIEQNASVNYTQTLLTQPEPLWHFDSFRATMKQDSRLNTISVTDGSHTVRHDWQVALTGENAEANLNGLWNLSDKREAHTNVLIDHQAPNCRSYQLFKGVLKDSSRSSFEGKIFVRQPAQKTDAFQLNRNLLLSEGASAHAKPNLEIFADDVKASHGATVGQLDEEQLFYMKSRGFEQTQAQTLLVHGFCQEIIDKIPMASLQKQVKALWFKNN